MNLFYQIFVIYWSVIVFYFDCQLLSEMFLMRYFLKAYFKFSS